MLIYSVLVHRTVHILYKVQYLVIDNTLQSDNIILKHC